ncbi:hypothetical protein SAMN05216184_11926 [Georgenia satyanarayanai]|uniref:Superoxide dismutase, Cu-Zn family n=1 Tax=Georgenia satyanarayanai TaxID=860221 RepID=A0A2Y9AS34_9MICO|nr:hypothetical protein [Georgenia satyanarayanai]PYF96366.1 hypothetical protein A8987_11926 [Georgenia satyanarayanai]SSA46905.1 hypothetical protein SAMN05216184_11926 [Georgenia satyanarayanai]
MNRTGRLTAATLGVALVLSACGSDDPESASTPAAQDTATAAPTEDGADTGEEEDAHANHGGGDSADPTPVTVSLLGTSTGHFEPVEGRGDMFASIEGTAVLEKSETGTTMTVNASGLDPQFTYPSHMHDGACSTFGGHYQQDPSGPMSPPNEIWGSSSADPSGDLEPNSQGMAVGQGSADWVPRTQDLAVQIHEPEMPGFPVVCADFSAYDSPVTIVLEADATHGADIETIEYSLNDGEMLTYEGPVEVAEAGDHVLVVQGVDANGTATDPQEFTFVIDDAA